MADFTLHLGDCRDVMRELEADSVDTIITDPPYGLSFMGKDWDHGVPGVRFWTEALRVAKPGAHLLAFGGTRTHHRLMVAIEDAGWEIRDCIFWTFGSGFPKSHSIGKALAKNGHAEAEKWDGYGTALKPAYEIIILAMKPIPTTFAENALEHGVAGLWIDGGRVPTDDDTNARKHKTKQTTYEGNTYSAITRDGSGWTGATGRWPANLIHDGSPEVLAGFPVSKSGVAVGRNASLGKVYGNGKGLVSQAKGDDRLGYGDTGSAARFFYTAKASRSERNAGLEGMEEREATKMDDGSYHRSGGVQGVGPDRTGIKMQNHHPTVKPLALMRYLCKLTRTPTGGVVLDPFMGSGSTGCAAMLEGRDFIGIEQEAEHIEIARRRIEHWREKRISEAAKQPPLFTDNTEPKPDPKQEVLL